MLCNRRRSLVAPLDWGTLQPKIRSCLRACVLIIRANPGVPTTVGLAQTYSTVVLKNLLARPPIEAVFLQPHTAVLTGPLFFIHARIRPSFLDRGGAQELSVLWSRQRMSAKWSFWPEITPAMNVRGHI